MVKELDKTCEVISSLANVNKEDILSDKRAWPLPACRDVLFMHYRKLGFSGNSIGRMFNRDHSTVFSGINRLKSWIDAHDKFVTQLYESFNDECG